MKKTVKGLAAASVIVLLLGVGYIGLALYYQDEFAANTWINGVYCTGRSVEEVNRILLEQTVMPAEFTVTGYDGIGSLAEEVTWTLKPEEIRLASDYGKALNAYLAEQNSWLWPGNILFSREHIIEPDINIDETALLDWWGQIVDGFHAEPGYRIEYSEESGYTLYDGVHNCLDVQKAYETVREAVLAGESSVDLIGSGCYYDIPLTKSQEELAVLWKKIERFQGGGPVYDFGDGAEPLSRAQMCAFLEKDDATKLPVVDEEGHFVLVKNCAADWVREMALEHDTYKKEWEFHSTRGDTVTVKGVTYGTTINQKREAAWFEEYLEHLAQMSVSDDEQISAETEWMHSGYEDVPGVEVHTPEYTRDAFNRSSTEIGDTYIEVDMGVQKLYYYERGTLKLETDVVTGNARRRMSTPEGVNYVYSKQKNRILRGQGYATPVKFWMPVKGSIGIHDADWRDEFGGDVYKTNGSHGCVNVPEDVMPKLYDMVEIGTPVIMFYGEEPETDEIKNKIR